MACQAPLSVGFSRKEHWSGLPFPSPEDGLSVTKLARSYLQFASVHFFSFLFYIGYKSFINSRSSWWATASTQTSSTQSQVQRSLRASHSDSKRVSTSPSRTGPFTFRMMERLVSSMNSTRTCVHCPCEPVLPNPLVTLASLMGCTRLVSMMAARRRSGGENQYIS